MCSTFDIQKYFSTKAYRTTDGDQAPGGPAHQPRGGPCLARPFRDAASGIGEVVVVRELLVSEHTLHHGGWSDVVVAHLVRPRGDGGVEVREAASRLPGAPGGRAGSPLYI